MNPHALDMGMVMVLGFALLGAGVFGVRTYGVGPLAVGLCVMAGATIAWGLIVYRDSALTEQAVAGRPVAKPHEGYVTSDTCRACHAQEYATWDGSYHRKMTQIASPDSVLASFNDVRLELHGQTFNLERHGDEFFVEMPDLVPDASAPKAARTKRPIVMTTGSHHMQLYWFASGYSRVTGLLPFAYLPDEDRWIPRQAAFLRPATTDVELELGRWSFVCLKCHATNARPRVDMDTTALRAADTEVSEFAIACEACHGPARDHVRANRDPRQRYLRHFSDEPDPTVVNPANLPHRLSAQVCGQCHALFDDTRSGDRLREWFKHGFLYRPGDDLEQTRKARREGWEQQFWSDGMVRVAGREYNGLIASPCFERGEMSCVSCHIMHKPADDPRPVSEWADDQLAMGMDGDQACLQCHQSFGESTAEHTHHKADSAGSRCYNCHMPHTVYGLLKGIRSHQVDSPTVAKSLETGRPNACNQCHLDQTLAWTAKHLEDWYGTPVPRLFKNEREISAAAMWTLSGDAAQRALMAWSLGWGPAKEASGSRWMAPYLAQLLDDPYEAVRFIAHRSLRRLSGFEDFDYQFVGPPASRAAARQRAMEIWRQSAVAGDPDKDARVLIGPDGGLRRDVFDHLLRRRDNRDISLLE